MQGSYDISSKKKQIQLVIFHVREEEFGVPIDEIQEIIKVGNITPIPDAPAFISGIINVRGDIVTTIDMKSRFAIRGKKNYPARHIVITKQNDSLFGLMVDEVTEVLRVEENEIKPPPSLITQIDKEYVKGIVTFDGRLLILLNLSKVLSPDEFAKLAEISQDHQKKSLSEARNRDANKQSDLKITTEEFNLNDRQSKKQFKKNQSEKLKNKVDSESQKD